MKVKMECENGQDGGETKKKTNQHVKNMLPYVSALM